MKQTKLVLMAAVAGVVASESRLVSADVIVFDNQDGAFALRARGDSVEPRSVLDPTLPAAAQTSQGLFERGFYHFAASGGGSDSPQGDGFFCGANMRLARSTTPIEVRNGVGAVTTFFPTQVFAAGESVGNGPDYQETVITALFHIAGDAFHAPFLGQSAYMGFRLNLADGPHFGWVELDFRTGIFSSGGGTIPMYQPIRWAYESQPNVPIAVPGPSVGGCLAVGALAVGLRRRRAR